MMWLDFETRIRILIQKYIGPVIELSIEDREATIQVEHLAKKLEARAQLLEQAVFKVDSTKSTTIFDEYSEKMTNMDIFLQTEIQKIKDEQLANTTQIKEQIFGQDQKVKLVLQMGQEIEIAKEDVQ